MASWLSRVDISQGHCNPGYFQKCPITKKRKKKKIIQGLPSIDFEVADKISRNLSVNKFPLIFVRVCPKC